MRFGDVNDYDIDNRNANGDMYQARGYNCDCVYGDQMHSSSTAKKPMFQFNTLHELLSCQEVQDLLQKTIAHKQQQIIELQNELLRIIGDDNGTDTESQRN